MRSDGTLWHYAAAASTPTQFFGQDAGPPVVVSYADGYDASCAVLADHTVYCWTYPGVRSTNGDLGDGTDGGSTVPTLVVTSEGGPPLSGIVKVFMDTRGGYASCALDANGAVWCWGQNTFRALADGGQTRSYAALPVLLSSGGSQLSGATKIAVSASHACAIRTDGTLWCWGPTHRFVSPDNPYPVQMTALPGPVRDVAADGDATCAVTSDGIATPDGGSYIPDNAPIQVTAQSATVTDALQVEMPSNAVCILRGSNRSIWCNGTMITGTADLSPWSGALNDTTGVFFMGTGVGAPCYIDSQRQLAISGFSVTVPLACP
jgi:alpha-tubulin suppressor-like RCC1 family protein